MSTSIIPEQARTKGDRSRFSIVTRGLSYSGKAALLLQLKRLQFGSISIVADGNTWCFGDASADPELRTCITVNSPQFWANAAFGGSVGAAESYIQSQWDCDNLTGLIRIMVRNREVMNGLEGGLALFSAPLRALLHWLNRNTKDGSRRNIAAHYDLGNDFFRLILDDTMAYSCAVYPYKGATLLEAQQHKYDTICRQLALTSSDHLLEIGTGWGGLAIHAARYFGCCVTTTTISHEQYLHAQSAIAQAGLTSRITLLEKDYRDLEGTYDKLVSVEMIEAVGHKFLDNYFGVCNRLLKPNGAMLLQAITIQDQHYNAALKSVDFIQRFVFPGSFIPSIDAIQSSLRRATDLKVFHLHDIGPHYARTLADWRRNFHSHLAAVRQLGYPDSFIRLWDYYLSYCEGGFEERQLGDVHMLLTKPLCRRSSLA